jgi:ABC-type transporter Mla subunit MlaD
MTAIGVAALIAAASFGVLACAGVYLTVRFSKLLGAAATLFRETGAGQRLLLDRANAAVDRANAQLDKHEAVAASMDELGASVAELADQASALAGLGKTVAGALIGGPAGKAAAVAYGFRHAVGVRRGARQRRPLAGQLVPDAELPSAQSRSGAAR